LKTAEPISICEAFNFSNDLLYKSLNMHSDSFGLIGLSSV